MPLKTFDHVNIRTANLDAMVDWYADILGLTTGFRPDFSFPGAWLYLGDQAIVHLVGTSTSPQVFGPDENLRMEHMAFRASDFTSFKARLEARGVPYRAVEIEDIDTIAVNIHDPDGNHIHVDFERSEATANSGPGDNGG